MSMRRGVFLTYIPIHQSERLSSNCNNQPHVGKRKSTFILFSSSFECKSHPTHNNSLPSSLNCLIIYLMPDKQPDFEAGVKRPSYAARARRTYYVIKLLSQGTHTHEILEICSTAFELSKQQIHSYIRKAKREAYEAATGSNEKLLTDCVIDLRALYLKALQAGELAVALNVRKEMNKVLKIERAVSDAQLPERVIPPGVGVETVRRGLPEFVEQA